MKTRCAILFILLLSTSRADRLDDMVSPDTPDSKQEELFEGLKKTPFPVLGMKLAQLLGQHALSYNELPLRWSVSKREYGSRPKEDLTPEGKARSRLLALWRHHLPHPDSMVKHFGLLLEMVEEPSVQNWRQAALTAIEALIEPSKSRQDRSLPLDLAEVLNRLERVAMDEDTPLYLRQRCTAILWERGNPNRYLDLVISLAGQAKDDCRPHISLAGQTHGDRRAWTSFEYCTPRSKGIPLTHRTRYGLLRYGFSLLKRHSDEKSWVGYNAAQHLGYYGKVSLLKGRRGLFAPDHTQPQYQKESGLTSSYYDETVANALDWWNRNHLQFRHNAGAVTDGVEPRKKQ